jgi:hypothetical protein
MKMQTSGKQKFLNKNKENVKAEISLITTDLLKQKLKAGCGLDFREGNRIIGAGTIIEVLNNELLLT